LSNKKKIEEEQKRIEVERLRIEQDHKMLEEEQKRMEEMMNRSPSQSPENYYQCEIKVCSSPFPLESPLTIPAIVTTQEAKSTSSSPEMYFTSDVKVTTSPYASPMTVPTLRQMNNSPFLNRSSFHEDQSQSASSMSSLSVNKSQQRHSMYETSSLSACSTTQQQSQTMQQSTTFQQQQQQNQNTIPIPIQKSALPPLQPLGGRADVTAQPDQDDPSSSVSSNASPIFTDKGLIPRSQQFSLPYPPLYH